MAKVQLNQKEQHYADTREEAEEIVTDAKENDALIMNKISEKYNKYGQYFLVDLTYQHNTPKEVMENPPKDNVPEGQLSIEDVKPEEESEEFDPNSVQFEEETPAEENGEQKSIKELEEELPF